MNKMKFLPLEPTQEMLSASGIDPETAAKVYALMTTAFDGSGVTVRKAFICDQCECVYSDTPVTACDCAVRKTAFIEGEISYPSLA